LRSRETSEGLAEELAHSGDIRDPSASDNILAQLQKVSAADVQRVARSIMDDTRAVTIRYLPEKPAQRAMPLRIRRPSRRGDRHSGKGHSVYRLRRKASAGSRPLPVRDRGKGAAVSEKTLDNGLRVIVAHRPGLPLVAADCASARAVRSTRPTTRALRR